MKRAAQGFTLLEVMISLGILAIALVALSDLNGGAVQMHAYAREATQATLLVQSKMLDLEELLTKEGFHDFDDEKHGAFDEAPGYSWRAEILKPDVQLDDGALLGMLGVGPGAKKGAGGNSASGTGASGLTDALGGAGALLGQAGGLPGGAGALGGAGGMGALAAAGPFAGLIQGQAKAFIETLKKSVRELRITVSWKDGKNERSVSASQQIVILPEMVGKAGQVPQATQQPNQAVPGSPVPGVGSIPGQPAVGTGAQLPLGGGVRP
jgi:general secretion pathway protein I